MSTTSHVRGSKRVLTTEDRLQDNEERSSKRHCLTEQPDPSETVETNKTTDLVYQELTQLQQFSMPMEQFVGLCAYLCTILQWGYRIPCHSLDGFVTSYHVYTSRLDDLEARRMADPSFLIPAYHQWFLSYQEETHDDSLPRASVLSEDRLRAIWREHPYSFLRTQWSLEMIAKRMQEKRMQQHPGLS